MLLKNMGNSKLSFIIKFTYCSKHNYCCSIGLIYLDIRYIISYAHIYTDSLQAQLTELEESL